MSVCVLLSSLFTQYIPVYCKETRTSRDNCHTHKHTHTGVEHEEGPSVTAERLGWFLRLGNSPYDVATDGQDSPI